MRKAGLLIAVVVVMLAGSHAAAMRAAGAAPAAPAGPDQRGAVAAVPEDGGLSRLVEIEVLFKMDRQLTRGLYMGDRWVSPATYSAVGSGTAVRVEARAVGVDGRGRRVRIPASWSSGDPEMLTIAPALGDDVTITVRRRGECRILVGVAGLSKELAVKVTGDGAALRVDIVQQTGPARSG